MNDLTGKKIVIIHSIIWAVMMLVLAYLIRGNAQTNIIFIFMLGGWYISHAIIIKQANAKGVNCESGNKSKICCR